MSVYSCTYSSATNVIRATVKQPSCGTGLHCISLQGPGALSPVNDLLRQICPRRHHTTAVSSPSASSPRSFAAAHLLYRWHAFHCFLDPRIRPVSCGSGRGRLLSISSQPLSFAICMDRSLAACVSSPVSWACRRCPNYIKGCSPAVMMQMYWLLSMLASWLQKGGCASAEHDLGCSQR